MINVLYFLFMFHLMINLERFMLVNEIFAFIGLIYYIRFLKSYMTIRQNPAMLSVNFLIVYGFIYAVVSFMFLRDGTVYQFIRTLPVYYSIFAFFLGIEFVKKTTHLTQNNSFINKCRYPFALAIIFVEGRLTNQSLMPLLFYDGRMHKTALFLLLLITTAYKRNITSVLILGCYLLFLLIQHRRKLQRLILNKYVLFAVVGCFVCGMYYVNNRFSDFYTIGYAYFNKYEFIHVNVYWRMMFWAYEFANNIMHNLLFGIGFGTKLFDATDPNAAFLTTANPYDLDYEYTLGTHNSFVFILIRLGIFGLLPVLCMYIYFFKHITRNRILDDPLAATCSISFMFITIAALFNVVLESPLFASAYWIITGMFYQSVQLTKTFVKRNNSQSYDSVEHV